MCEAYRGKALLGKALAGMSVPARRLANPQFSIFNSRECSEGAMRYSLLLHVLSSHRYLGWHSLLPSRSCSRLLKSLSIAITNNEHALGRELIPSIIVRNCYRCPMPPPRPWGMMPQDICTCLFLNAEHSENFEDCQF